MATTTLDPSNQIALTQAHTKLTLTYIPDLGSADGETVYWSVTPSTFSFYTNSTVIGGDTALNTLICSDTSVSVPDVTISLTIGANKTPLGTPQKYKFSHAVFSPINYDSQGSVAYSTFAPKVNPNVNGTIITPSIRVTNENDAEIAGYKVLAQFGSNVQVFEAVADNGVYNPIPPDSMYDYYSLTTDNDGEAKLKVGVSGPGIVSISFQPSIYGGKTDNLVFILKQGQGGVDDPPAPYIDSLRGGVIDLDATPGPYFPVSAPAAVAAAFPEESDNTVVIVNDRVASEITTVTALAQDGIKVAKSTLSTDPNANNIIYYMITRSGGGTVASQAVGARAEGSVQNHPGDTGDPSIAAPSLPGIVCVNLSAILGGMPVTIPKYQGMAKGDKVVLTSYVNGYDPVVKNAIGNTFSSIEIPVPDTPAAFTITVPQSQLSGYGKGPNGEFGSYEAQYTVTRNGDPFALSVPSRPIIMDTATGG